MIDDINFRLLQDQLCVQEDFRDKPYKDTQGYLTIGIGWNIDAMPMTKKQALYINADHIRYFDEQLHNMLPFYDALDGVRKSVLINMAFNLGMIKLQTFKRFLNLISTKAFAQAAAEMLNSLWAKQVGQRAHVLSEMIRTGQWPTN